MTAPGRWEPVYTLPWALRAWLLVGAIVWGLALLGVKSLCSQVTAVTELHDGTAELIVANPTPEPLAVTLMLFRDATVAGGPVVLGDTVAALISPRACTLGPGARQVVRIKVRSPVAAGDVLRLTTTFSPLPAAPAPPAAGMRLTVQTQVVSKLVAVP